jgi:hypothetical protein
MKKDPKSLYGPIVLLPLIFGVFLFGIVVVGGRYLINLFF